MQCELKSNVLNSGAQFYVGVASSSIGVTCSTPTTNPTTMLNPMHEPTANAVMKSLHEASSRSKNPTEAVDTRVSWCVT